MSSQAKVGDQIYCPKCQTNTTITTGSPKMWIDFQPVARVGDKTSCGATIVEGISYYTIDFRKAARAGCRTSHGGVIQESGCTTGAGNIIPGQAPGPSGTAPPTSAISTDPNGNEFNHVYFPEHDEEGGKYIQMTASGQFPSGHIGAASSMLDNAKRSLEEIKVTMEGNPQYIAFLTVPEAKEFLDNLWAKTHAKDVIGKGKEVKETIDKISEAKEIAKGLGGLGVIAYTKTYKGQDYIILKNFKKDMKTLLAGTRYRADNPKVIELGLGSKSGLRELKVGFRGAVFFAAALDFADYAMSDQQTWVDLVGHIGSDVVKGVVATEVGVFVGELIMGGVATLASAPVLAGVFAIGAASAVIALIAGAFIDYEDDYKLHVTDQLIDKMKEEFHKL